MTVGGDLAGLGGNERYVRGKLDTAYYIPLDYLTGNHDWNISIKAGTGYLADYGGGRQDIVDNFYLGGSNLRGFYDGGVGPYSKPTNARPTADALGGRFLYTQSTQLNFPLPVGPDLGLSGRYFVDIGGLSGSRVITTDFSRFPNSAGQAIVGNDLRPRVGTGVGVSWKSPFGLINVDLGIPVVKQASDKQQVFRFGFGSNF